MTMNYSGFQASCHSIHNLIFDNGPNPKEGNVACMEGTTVTYNTSDISPSVETFHTRRNMSDGSRFVKMDYTRRGRM
jgi:hypothetical protein